MRTSKRVAISAIALTAALGLTGCNSENAPTTTGTSSSSSSDNSSNNSSSSSSSETSPSSSDSSPSSSEPNSGSSGTGKGGLDHEVSAIPSGPMTKMNVIQLGGYRSGTTDYTDFYAVLEIDATETGYVDVDYELLDASGNKVGSVDDHFAVSKGQKVIKVTSTLDDKVPASAKKVRLKVTSNEKNRYANTTQIDPTFKISENNGRPVVSGRYKIEGDSDAIIIRLSAVCTDDKGVTRVASTSAKDVDTRDWAPFEIEFDVEAKGFKPTKCYVGS